MSRSRNWMGVIYNPLDATKHHNFGGLTSWEEVIQTKLVETEIIPNKLKFFVKGTETCPTTLTQHFQCFFIFKNDMSINSLRKNFEEWLSFPCTISFVKADKNVKECIKYCTKDGIDLLQLGEQPAGKGSRTDLSEVVDIIQSGGNLTDITTSCPEQFIHYSTGIQKLMMYYVRPRNFKTEVYWIYGPTGTGKSRWAINQMDPNSSYFKSGSTKWWDGYCNQKDVLIDDFRPTKDLPFDFILRLFDRYPLLVESKGGSTHFTSQRIFVTTPHSVEETFSHCDWLKIEDFNQINRRIFKLMNIQSTTDIQLTLQAPTYVLESNIQVATTTATA